MSYGQEQLPTTGSLMGSDRLGFWVGEGLGVGVSVGIGAGEGLRASLGFVSIVILERQGYRFSSRKDSEMQTSLWILKVPKE